MNPSLSIVVPVLNEIDQLSHFIAHIQDQWQQPQELLIIDGGSTDGTWEWLQKKTHQILSQFERTCPSNEFWSPQSNNLSAVFRSRRQQASQTL